MPSFLENSAFYLNIRHFKPKTHFDSGRLQAQQMGINNDFQVVNKLLADHDQSQLFVFWDQLNPAQKQNLLAQIDELDWARIDDWVVNVVRETHSAADLDLSPADSYPPAPANKKQEKTYEKARALGHKLVSKGKVAAFVVAGGQGTRLGFDGPKGEFRISPVKNKTLFQLFAEQIAAVSRKYNVKLPWYVMTSPLNYSQTLEVLQNNSYFGLGKENIFIFQQGTMPCFGFDGKILLADKATIACSPDGHGGSLKALYKSGALEDMKKRGVEYISYFQVDNPLINIFDELFIGLHVLDESEMSSKALIKTGPWEKVGNFCLANGKVTVIEYIDLPDELAEARNPDGSLRFQLGSIAIHMISVNFVERLNEKGFALPLHRAAKKIPHIDEQGNPIEPDEPNGFKLETFVFDALPLAKKSMILQTIREQEFGPVKNATGVDSAESARRMMIARWADWLESAGVKIPRKSDGTPDCKIEIASSFALCKEDIKAKVDEIPQIKPGEIVYLE